MITSQLSKLLKSIDFIDYDRTISKDSHGITVKTLKDGGAKQDRTADLLRARQALSQLSYSPIECVIAFTSFFWERSGGSEWI